MAQSYRLGGTREMRSAQPSAVLRDSAAVPVGTLVGVERVRGGGEEAAVRVRAQREIQVVDLRRMCGCTDRSEPGIRDRGGRQARVQPRVVRRRVGEL